MPPFSEPAPDPGHDEVPRDRAHRRPVVPRRPGRAHLHDLDLDPTLSRLADEGWHLDRLPSTSVALAFGAALLATLVTLGPIGTAPVVLTMVVAMFLAVAALGAGDVPACRVTLRGTRAILVAWALFCICTGP